MFVIASVSPSHLMKRFRSLSGMLAILALIGLIIAPAAPGFVISAAAMQSGVSMPEDMACCPDERLAPECSKACPFAVVCAALFASIQTPDTEASFVRSASEIDAYPNLDSVLSSLVRGPPPRPPQA